MVLKHRQRLLESRVCGAVTARLSILSNANRFDAERAVEFCEKSDAVEIVICDFISYAEPYVAPLVYRNLWRTRSSWAAHGSIVNYEVHRTTQRRSW